MRRINKTIFFNLYSTMYFSITKIYTTGYTAIMYKIIPAQLCLRSSRFVNWIIIVPDGGLYLNLYVLFHGSRTPLRGFSGLPIATSASRLFRRPAYESPSPYTLEPIGIVLGRRMGFFRNNIINRFNSTINVENVTSLRQCIVKPTS